MSWSQLDFRPSARTVRQFAALWLLFFTGLAIWQWTMLDNLVGCYWLAAIALVGGTVGLLRPALLRPTYVGWMIMVFPVGWVVSHALLAILFFGLVTPFALLFKLIGRDALRLRAQPEQPSYW